MHNLQLNWTKCQEDVWCKLNSVNLDHSHFNYMEGVYIIWHGGLNPAVVYVGQGVIKDRLTEHRDNSQIQQFAQMDLYATWANVVESYRDGVEAYLADVWKPKVGSHHPAATPIAVNSPW